MKLYANGELRGENLGEKELLEEVNRFLREQQKLERVVKHCYVDGGEVRDFRSQLPQYLKSEKAEQVELVSVHQEELVVETLHSALEYLDNLTNFLGAVVQDLEQGKGYQRDAFLNFVEGLEWLYTATRSLAAYLGSEKLGEMQDRLQSDFQQVNQGLESGDAAYLKEVLNSQLSGTLEELKIHLDEALEGLEE